MHNTKGDEADSEADTCRRTYEYASTFNEDDTVYGSEDHSSSSEDDSTPDRNTEKTPDNNATTESSFSRSTQFEGRRGQKRERPWDSVTIMLWCLPEEFNEDTLSAISKVNSHITLSHVRKSHVSSN